MSDLRRYAYLQTRIALLARQLLNEDQLQQLSELPLGDRRETELLEQSGLERHIETAADAIPALEQGLTQALLAEFQVLVRPVRGVGREFLLQWLRSFSLGNLKAIIRGELLGLDDADIRSQLVNLGQHAILPIDDLLRTEDIAELLRRLESTRFAEIAREGREIFEERHELFALDAAIDRLHFAGLSRAAERLETREQALLQPLMGLVIDRLNLTWLLRYRFAFGLSPAETYYQLISSGYRLTPARLRELVKLDSLEAVVAALPADYARQLAGVRNAAEVERSMQLWLLRLTRTTLAKSTYTLAGAYAYLLARRSQMRQILAVLKGKLLQLEPELIQFAGGFTGGRLPPGGLL